MAASFNASVPRFKIIFDIFNQTITFEDTVALYTSYTGTFQGIIKITHEKTPTILYQNDGWGTTAPSFSSPDIESGTWSVSDIDMVTDDYLGDYTFEYMVTMDGGTTFYKITKTFTLDYTSPEVTIDMTVLNSTSQLISEDTTDYDLEFSGVTVQPTITRTHTITKPAGSGANAPGAVTDNGESPSRTIGGGSTDATRLWTRIWQTNIATELSYAVAAWSDDEPTVIITDTVYGDDDVFAQNDTTISELAQCYRNMLDRWTTSLTSNFNYRDNNRDKIIQANSLWIQLQWLERIGESVDDTIDALKTLLSYVSDTCPASPDTKSEVIVPWAALTGTGGTPSTFSFTVTDSEPTDEVGYDGDLWLYTVTWFIYQKVSGHWTSKGCVQGAAGADANPEDHPFRLMTSEANAVSTLGTTTLTTLKTLAIQASEFDNTYDYKEFLFELELGTDFESEKSISLYYGVNKVFDWTYDGLVDDDETRITLRMKVIFRTDLTQMLVITMERARELVGPKVIRTWDADGLAYQINIASAQLIQLKAQTDDTRDYISCDYSSTIVGKVYYEAVPDDGGGTITGRGLVSETFTAYEGQTSFDVLGFICNSYCLAFIDGNLQSPDVVVRSGNNFTTPALSAGQTLTIVD